MRPVETTSASVEAASLEEIQELLESHRPEGFDLISSPVEMIKGASILKSTGTFARRDQVTEIQAEDLDGLHAKVPEGWQLLSVVSA